MGDGSPPEYEPIKPVGQGVVDSEYTLRIVNYVCGNRHIDIRGIEQTVEGYQLILADMAHFSARMAVAMRELELEIDDISGALMVA